MSVAAACLQRAGGGKDELCWGTRGLGRASWAPFMLGPAPLSPHVLLVWGCGPHVGFAAHFLPAAFPACVLPASAAS